MRALGLSVLTTHALASPPMEASWQVDRIEADRAVLVRGGRHTHSVPLRALPAGLREGDVLTRSGQTVDTAAKEALLTRVQRARAEADASARAGDFSLEAPSSRLTPAGQR